MDLLAPAEASKLAVIGLGRLGQAHALHVLPLLAWQDIRLHSLDIANLPESKRQMMRDIDPRVSIHDELASAIDDADVIMLCTSAGHTVLDPSQLNKPAVITSICTNSQFAHEVPPASLLHMDVYCDYRATTPDSAGEMQLAKQHHDWTPTLICGDLSELVAGTAKRPHAGRHTFFRSIGLGLEDIAIANELYQLHVKNSSVY